jgi:hypothetical protein
VARRAQDVPAGRRSRFAAILERDSGVDPARRPDEQARLEVFPAKQGVDIVAGHMRYYMRHVQDGVTYVTKGGAGSYVGPITQTPWDQFDVTGYSEYGYTIFKYAPKTRTVALTSYIVRARAVPTATMSPRRLATPRRW